MAIRWPVGYMHIYCFGFIVMGSTVVHCAWFYGAWLDTHVEPVEGTQRKLGLFKGKMIWVFGLYFDFYYKHKCKQYGAISNSIKVGDLLSKELIILPKILSTAMGDVNEAEAYQFEQVKMANEHRRFKAFKIDKYRQKKIAFLLEIDRYRFVGEQQC